MRYKKRNINKIYNSIDKSLITISSIKNNKNIIRIRRNTTPSRFSTKLQAFLKRKPRHVYKKPSSFNISSTFPISIVLASILILGSIIGIISSTVVFTPMFFVGGTMGGVKFGSIALLLLFGIGFIFFSHKNILGYVLVLIGICVMCFSIFSSLRMGFLPTSLFKTILIFGSFFAGLALIAKYFFKHKR